MIDKPAGMSTVPFGDEDAAQREDTLDALVRDVLARKDKIRGRAPLGVVQRLDKETSGLLVFARTFAAKKHLAQQLRAHTMHRATWPSRTACAPRGRIAACSSPTAATGCAARAPRQARAQREGQLAVTHVEPLEALAGATPGALPPGDRPHAPDPHPPLRGRPPARRRDGLHAGLPRHAHPRAAADAARRRARLRAPGDERPMRFERAAAGGLRSETLARLRRKLSAARRYLLALPSASLIAAAVASTSGITLA